MIAAAPASWRPALARSAALLVAGVLTAAGSQAAAAAPSASTGSPAAVSAPPATTASASGSVSPTAGCPARVSIILGRIIVDNGVVTITFTHTGQGCSSAQPVLVHVHQNLLAAPRAGSDPAHQRNDDVSVGPDSADQVTVPLLRAVPGKCFVQVDVHAGGTARGRFFPTATCPSPGSSSPAPSSSAPSSSASSSSVSSSTAPTSTPPPSTAPSTSQSFLSASESRSAAVLTVVAVARQSQPFSSGSLASTGAIPAAPLGLAAVLFIAGAGLMYWARRPRRH
jgi:hypothetical protein